MEKYLCTYRFSIRRVIEAKSKYEAKEKMNAIIDCNNPEDIATLDSAECKPITDEEYAKLLEDE